MSFWSPGTEHTAQSCNEEIIQISGIWPAWRTIVYLLIYKRWGVTWHCLSELRELVCLEQASRTNVHWDLKERRLVKLCFLTCWHRSWMEQEKWWKKRRQFSLLQFWALCTSSLFSPGGGGQHTPFCMNELPFGSFPWEGLCFSIILLLLFMWHKHDPQLPLTLQREWRNTE